jgi:hypothetical protein
MTEAVGMTMSASEISVKRCKLSTAGGGGNTPIVLEEQDDDDTE